MADWNALHAYLQQKYPLKSDDEGRVSIEFTFEDSRTQSLFVARSGSIGGTEWASIGTPVCGTEQLSAAEALERNFDFKVGALASFAGKIWFMHRLPLQDLQASEIDIPLQIVAVIGDELERELTGQDQF